MSFVPHAGHLGADNCAAKPIIPTANPIALIISPLFPIFSPPRDTQ